MKKTFTKQIVILSVLLGIAAVPVFAAGNAKNPNKNQRDPAPAENPGPRRQGFAAVAMGTVVDVDSKSGIITIEDADGNKERIHFNPTTRFYNFTDFKADEDAPGFGPGFGMDGMGMGPQRMPDNDDFGGPQNMMGNGIVQQQNSDDAAVQKQMLENRQKMQEERQEAMKKLQDELKKCEIQISDLKVGDWIQVSAYPSTTKTLESRVIRVYR